MSVYAISYRPRKTDDSKALRKAIEAYENVHPLETYWYVFSNKSASDIYEDLRQHVDNDDSILVYEVRSK